MNPTPSNSWLKATGLAAATKANVKATAGSVRAIHVTNANAAARYFQLHNKATAPAATDVPYLNFYIPAGGSITIGAEFFGQDGLYLPTGIGWAVSTTIATFTDSATADEHAVNLIYF